LHLQLLNILLSQVALLAVMEVLVLRVVVVQVVIAQHLDLRFHQVPQLQSLLALVARQ
jgi:hypothetical protein